MAFDFKKEYKEYYMPKNTPEIVDGFMIMSSRLWRAFGGRITLKV